VRFTTYERALRRALRSALRNLDLLVYPVEHAEPDKRQVRESLGKLQRMYDKPKADALRECGKEWSDDDLALSPEGYAALVGIFDCGLMDMRDLIEQSYTAEEKMGIRQAGAFISALKREVTP
tara:strand:+ start:55 stop:423 length:369 start_codon:yes stop_codon:yes gene_type:complete